MTSKIILKKSSVPSKVPLVADLEFGEIALNYADGKIFYKKSNNTIQEISGGGTTGTGLSDWVVVTANYTAAVGDRIIADTTAGSFTITLPAAPATGKFVQITDGGDWNVNNLTVARNGATIEGIADDLLIDIGTVTVDLIYTGTTWQVTATTGKEGPQGEQGPPGTPGGGGDVVGPASSTNNAVALFDGTTGKLLKNSGVVLPTFPSGIIVGATDTQTLTNKRVTPRVNNNGATTSGTITPTGDSSDQYEMLGLTSGVIIAIPSGTPVAGQKLLLRIKDNGANVPLTWIGTAGGYRPIGVNIPGETIANKNIYVGCVYNATESFWDVIAVSKEE